MNTEKELLTKIIVELNREIESCNELVNTSTGEKRAYYFGGLSYLLEIKRTIESNYDYEYIVIMNEE